MALGHTRRFSTLLIIREMQVRIRLRCLISDLQRTKSLPTPSVGKAVGKHSSTYMSVWTQNGNLAICSKITHKFYFETEIPLAGIYSKNTWTKMKNNINIKYLIVAPLAIAKDWKQSKYPSLGDWFMDTKMSKVKI